MNKKEKETIVNNILEDWKKLYKYKGGLEVSLEYNEEDDSITLTQFSYDHTPNNITIYNLEKKTIKGFNNLVSEDLRDYLRRRGIKIFTKNNFKSIK